MGSILGLAIVIIMVFGGYLLAGGKMEIILHSLPYEMMIIGGAAVGSFIVGNPLTVIKHTGADLGQLLKGPKWKKSDYTDLLCLMHSLVELARQSPVEIEAHIEDPETSTLFSRYPKIQKDHEAVELICDTIRSIMMNFDNVYQVEELLEKQLDAMHHDALHGSHALQKVADGLPALGIVAAVLGVIKTMASIDKPPEVLGQLIGGALVGTFLGVFLAYGVTGPFADKVKSIRDEEHRFYLTIKEVLIANLQKHAPSMCTEIARRRAPKALRPSFAELEESLKNKESSQ